MFVGESCLMCVRLKYSTSVAVCLRQPITSASHSASRDLCNKSAQHAGQIGMSTRRSLLCTVTTANGVAPSRSQDRIVQLGRTTCAQHACSVCSKRRAPLDHTSAKSWVSKLHLPYLHASSYQRGLMMKMRKSLLSNHYGSVGSSPLRIVLMAQA